MKKSSQIFIYFLNGHFYSTQMIFCRNDVSKQRNGKIFWRNAVLKQRNGKMFRRNAVLKQRYAEILHRVTQIFCVTLF